MESEKLPSQLRTRQLPTFPYPMLCTIPYPGSLSLTFGIVFFNRPLSPLLTLGH